MKQDLSKNISILIGKKLEQIRLHECLTHEEISERLVLSSSAYGRIARAESKISLEDAHRIFNVLGYCLLEILLENRNYTKGE